MLLRSVDWLVYSVFNLDQDSLWAASLHYFIYDTIKIFLLLFFMITIIGVIRTYIPPQKIKKLLLRTKKGLSNLLAASFGALTPFCSCSSIPVFLSFLRLGIPLGTTFSFLVTSPLVNEYLVVLMLGFFGWKITLLYVFFGIVIGVVAGLAVEKLGLERYIVKDIKGKALKEDKIFEGLKSRLKFGIDEAFLVIRKIWLWIIVGIGIGAMIHNLVPGSFIQDVMAKGGIFVIPAVVLLGVPIYGSCAAILPIAVALFAKGVPLGTALAFMMAVSALSFPEAVILRRAMELKLIMIFFGIVALGIIIIGYLFNALQGLIA